jgi:hypothetical protein
VRVLPLILLAAVAGCASDPAPRETPEAVAALGAAGGPTDQEKADQIEAIRFAIDNGYRIKNQNGQTLYCREDADTGSRVRTTVSCLTPQELKLMHDRFEDDLERIRRQGYGTGPGGGGG